MRRIGLDSNILAYLAGVDHHPSDSVKIDATQNLFDELEGKARLIVPSQALGELFSVFVRVRGSRDDARDWVCRFQEAFEIADCGATAMVAAFDLAVAHKLQLWDALIISAAADVGCTLLLSEDMQNGFSWRGLTIVNPFAEVMNEKLAALLAA